MKKMILIAACMAVSNCVPQIYLIDRPTLMEEEAAGQWPDLTQNFEKTQTKTNPDILTPQQVNRKNDRVMQTLVGEFETEAPAVKK